MSNIRGTRRVFTLPKFGTPELLLVAGENPPTDTFARRTIGAAVADAAAAMEKASGLLVITRDIVAKGVFVVDIFTPDYLKLGQSVNPVGTNDFKANVDPFAVALWLFGQGFTGKNEEDETIKEVLAWLDDTLVKATMEFAPAESQDAAIAAGNTPKVEQPEGPQPPEQTPVHEYAPDSDRCKNCDPVIRRLCEKFNRIDPATGKPYHN